MFLRNNYFLLPLIIFLLSACQSARLRAPFVPPANAFVITASFKHLAIEKNGTQPRLHVYIEGDGIPFENRFQIARDPSPSNPLMLALMSRDTNTSFYLGRPCYFNRSLSGLADEKCNARWWTNARYSDEVVTSMVSALRQELSTHPAKGITLIGHSGGGTLALLMAARMKEVDQVVTLAGNLDTQAWTRLHGYTPLKDSLNPADLNSKQLPPRQLHFIGDKDDNIPLSVGKNFLLRMGQTPQILADADHNCCWLQHWNEILARINQQMAQ